MKSRERVLAAIHDRQPDKIALDLNGHRLSGIAVQAYKKLRDYLGLTVKKIFVYDILQQLAAVEDDILGLFDRDVVQVGYDFYKDETYWQDWQLEDGTPCRIPGGGNISELTREAECIPPGSDGVLFLPYLAGERTPHLNPKARALFFGLTLSHRRAHFVRAVMEGVAFALKDSLEIVKKMGISVHKLVASGGESTSKLWLQIQADVF